MIALDAQAAFIFTPVLALLAALGVAVLVVVLAPLVERIATTKILRALFGRQPRGGDRHVDAARVHDKSVAVRAGVPSRAALSPRTVECPSCQSRTRGRGTLGEPRGYCPTCKGLGWIELWIASPERCGACEGTGRDFSVALPHPRSCPRCDGSGVRR